MQVPRGPEPGGPPQSAQPRGWTETLVPAPHHLHSGAGLLVSEAILSSRKLSFSASCCLASGAWCLLQRSGAPPDFLRLPLACLAELPAVSQPRPCREWEGVHRGCGPWAARAGVTGLGRSKVCFRNLSPGPASGEQEVLAGPVFRGLWKTPLASVSPSAAPPALRPDQDCLVWSSGPWLPRPVWWPLGPWMFAG